MVLLARIGCVVVVVVALYARHLHRFEVSSKSVAGDTGSGADTGR